MVKISKILEWESEGFAFSFKGCSLYKYGTRLLKSGMQDPILFDTRTQDSITTTIVDKLFFEENLCFPGTLLHIEYL